MVIKENQIYILIFFFCYGVFGSGITNENNLDFYYLFSPIIFFICVVLFNKKNEVILNLSLRSIRIIKNIDLILMFSIFIILLFFVYHRINLSLMDDEYAYAGLGLIHSNFIIPLISKNNILPNIEVRQFYRIISLIIILGIFIYFYFLNKIFKESFLTKIILIISTVLILRFIIFNFGGNSFIHPPLLATAPLVSVSFFGLSDLSIKLFNFIIYAIFACYYYLKLKNLNNSFESFLITISFFGIPGVLFIGSSLEQSLFSMICFSIIAIELLINENVKYKKLFIIILFFSLFRILSILSLILIACHILKKSNSIKNFIANVIIAVKDSYPLLLIFPFIFFSSTSAQFYTTDRLGSDFLNVNFFLHDLPRSIIDGYTIIPGILIIISLIILIALIKKTFLLFSFLIFLILVYGNVILNDNKYVYEIFFPILLSSMFIYYHCIKKKWIKNILILTLVFCNISNYVILKNFNSICLNDRAPFEENLHYKTNFGCKIIYTKPFNLQKAYEFLKNYEDFSFKKLYVPGVYYGLLPSIINGIKIEEFMEHKKVNVNQNKLNLLKNISWNSASAININSDHRIDFVILANMLNSKKTKDDLIKLGWSQVYIYKDPNFNTASIILKKN